MASLSPEVKADIVKQALSLADSLLINAPDAVEQSAQTFLQRHEASIARWLSMVSKDPEPPDGKITEDEFASLVRGLKDLDDMTVLASKVKTKQAINAFAEGLINTAIHVGLTAAFGPGGTVAAVLITDVIDGAKS